jgi:hypothetical protein
MPWLSSSLSRLISLAITCTCIGVYWIDFPCTLVSYQMSPFRPIQLARHWFAEPQTRDERSQPYPMVLLQRFRKSSLSNLRS